ncbi:hypothetical protein YC2023_067109 [Brassica napus]
MRPENNMYHTIQIFIYKRQFPSLPAFHLRFQLDKLKSIIVTRVRVLDPQHDVTVASIQVQATASYQKGCNVLGFHSISVIYVLNHSIKPSPSLTPIQRGGFDYRKDEINQTHEKVIRASETLESCNLIGKL